jgi:hypothetical protein
MAQQSKKIKDPLVRQFRAGPEVEAFYRFIHENTLRHETKVLLEIVLDRVKKGLKKSGKN